MMETELHVSKHVCMYVCKFLASYPPPKNMMCSFLLIVFMVVKIKHIFDNLFDINNCVYLCI